MASVHDISNKFVSDYVALDPITATSLGFAGSDDQLTDFSPEGHAARDELAARALADITAATPADASEEAARAVFLERTGLEHELYEAGQVESSLNVIASPIQSVRDIFDQMPTGTPDEWATIGRRLSAVPAALDGLTDATQLNPVGLRA